ncbi:MAG: S41 family peptidase [Anaerolineaceae bacterium]|nr:MAG: S41 family peptidase [Anaerolineaceae bacterium]
MSSRTKWIILLALGGLVGAVIIFSAGIAVGRAYAEIEDDLSGLDRILSQTRTPPPTGTAYPVPTPSDEIGALFEPFWASWEIVHEEFVDQPVDDVELMRGAIRGMLDSLGDQHTTYMDPDEYMQANIPLNGSYEGIGAWVDPDAEYLTIVSPMKDSPAERAGLKPGDEIIAVDGEDMTGVDGNIVIRRVLGPAGTTVRLTIRREGEPELFDVEIVRERITIPSIESEMLEGDIAYIHLLQFGTDTTDDLRATLSTLMAQNPRGLILDLRLNGGGFLTTAIEVASEFISEGVIMVEQFGDGSEEIYEADPGGLATEIPLVVLVNGGSASASEIVAGAIQDYERGLLVGETTFGKGSVQNWIALPGENGAVRVTIARWYTPFGRQIHQIGLIPDVEIIPTDEDIEADRDVQLEKAIELLTTSGGSSED